MSMKNANLLIDVHHHYNPLPLLSLDEKIKQIVMKGEIRFQDISESLKMMETYGITKSILSYPANFPLLSDKEYAILCTRINEHYAELVDKYFCLGAFASLPVSRNTEMMIQEMEYALDILHLNGVLLPTCISGIYPGCDIYNELYKGLNERKATVFLHPDVCMTKTEKTNKHTYELIAEVTKAACELTFNRIMHRYPNIRFILPYGGGNVSFFFQEMEYGILHLGNYTFGPSKNTTNGIESHLKSLHYDTVFFDPTNRIDYLRRFADKNHILYGSDYPFTSIDKIEKNMKILEVSKYEDYKSVIEYCRRNSIQI